MKPMAALLAAVLIAAPLYGEELLPLCEAAPAPDSVASIQDEPPQQEPPPPPPQPEPQEPAPPKEPPPKRPSLRPRDFWRDVKVEAKRYTADSYAIATAPLHWNTADWERFGGVVVLVGGLMFADETIDREVQQNRSRFTDRVSDATTDFGGAWASNVGVAFLASGYLFRSWDLRETGREILEAGLLSHLLDKYVLKPAFGRERPFESNGETHFHLGSSHDSFPSGHATHAFSLASVIAYRSKGWVVPVLAYGAAAFVAYDRMNDRVHFASDVAAGAILGTAIGKFIVRRHMQAQEKGLQKQVTDIQLVPIPGGLAARLVF